MAAFEFGNSLAWRLSKAKDYLTRGQQRRQVAKVGFNLSMDSYHLTASLTEHGGEFSFRVGNLIGVEYIAVLQGDHVL